MVDRPATSSTLETVAARQSYETSQIPTPEDNTTKIFDADSALTDTSISGAYIDDIWFRYSIYTIRYIDAVTPTTGTYSANSTTCTVTIAAGHNVKKGHEVWLDFTTYRIFSIISIEFLI